MQPEAAAPYAPLCVRVYVNDFECIHTHARAVCAHVCVHVTRCVWVALAYVQVLLRACTCFAYAADAFTTAADAFTTAPSRCNVRLGVN